MLVIAACVVLVAVGVALVVLWGDKDDGSQPRPGPARHVGVCILAGIIAGVLVAGAGGRLVMRVLALTSDVDGSITEAGEVVGEISLGGTAGLIFFSGLTIGFATGALYALLRPVLPRGRAGGAVFGLILLVLIGTRVEPLRSDNVDFRLLEPAWLAVVGFAAVAILHGMVVAAVAGRLSPSWAPRFLSEPGRVLTAGRIALAVVVLVALPGAVGAITDILEPG
jgi:hypothetical protein